MKALRQPPISRVNRVGALAPARPLNLDAQKRSQQAEDSPAQPPSSDIRIASLEERVRVLQNVIERVLLPALPPAGSIISLSSGNTPTTSSTWLPLDGAAAIERWYDATEAGELITRAHALEAREELVRNINGRVCVRAAAHTPGGPTTRLIKITRHPSTVFSSTMREDDTHGNDNT